MSVSNRVSSFILSMNKECIKSCISWNGLKCVLKYRIIYLKFLDIYFSEITSEIFPFYTGRNFNVHKTFNLRFLSRSYTVIDSTSLASMRLSAHVETKSQY